MTHQNIFGILLLLLAFGILFCIFPTTGILSVLLIVFHELGHFVVLKYYKNFDKFSMIGVNPGLLTKHSAKTLQESVLTNMSGFLFSFLILPITFCVTSNLLFVLFLLIGAVLASSYDFLNIIRYYRRLKE